MAPRHRTCAARKCPALLAGAGPARTRASLRSDRRAFPPPPAAVLGAVKGAQEQEQKQQKPEHVALDLRAPFATASARRKGPQGGRDGSLPVRCQHMEVLSANPGVRSRTCGASPRKRGSGGVFLLVTFLCTSKEKLHARCKRAEALLCKAPDSALAGMTSDEATLYVPNRKSATCSAIIIVGALVLPPGRQGMIEASTTRKPATPRTRNSVSTTALMSSALPMRQVPTGW